MSLALAKISETPSTITLGWSAVPGAYGYRFSSEKSKASWTWDPARTSVKFAKGSAWYKVEALEVVDEGVYPPPASERSGVGYLRYGNGELPLSHVTDYDTIVTSFGGAPAVGANAQVKQGLVYMSCVSCKSNAGGSYYFGVGLEEARANGWILKDAGGNELLNAGYPGSSLGDLGSPGYQARWCQNVANLLDGWKIDGVFIDDVLYHFAGISGGVTPAKYPTQVAWLNAVESFATAIYDYFDPRGKFVVYNAGGWYPGSTDDYGNNDLALWQRLVAHCHGLNSETWVYHPSWPNEQRRSPVWESWVRLPQLTESNGKVFMSLCHSASSAVADWVHLSALLHTDDCSVFWTPNDGSYSSYDRSLVWHPTYDRLLSLGEPQGARFKSGSQWRRQFEGGVVWVDPTLGTAGVV